ncbi:MAG: hypothetical protein ABJJ05_09250 [Maribacter litoralis]|uniref:hypothetical protein n=1 Tax=Maribacter litoralis TaxID=2059726 RepID=UPI003297B563
MSIEKSLYLIFPLICLFLKREWQFIIILLLFLVNSPWERTQLYLGNELGDKNHLSFLDAISMGCMTAILIKKLTYSKWLNWTFLIVGWSMVVLIYLFRGIVYKAGIVDLGLNITILSSGISLILFWMYENHRSRNEKEYKVIRWLRHMGIYSYEIYLTQIFVVIFGEQLFKNFSLHVIWLIPYSLILIIISYFLGK